MSRKLRPSQIARLIQWIALGMAALALIGLLVSLGVLR